MVKIVFTLFLVLLAFANPFDRKCVPCHRKRKLPLKPIFFDYLLYHSSERLVKKAMREYLLHPDPKKSLVVGVKPYKHKIDPKELQKALDIYWERYKVIGKLK